MQNGGVDCLTFGSDQGPTARGELGVILRVAWRGDVAFLGNDSRVAPFVDAGFCWEYIG